jgi:hypothetical protein
MSRKRNLNLVSASTNTRSLKQNVFRRRKENTSQIATCSRKIVNHENQLYSMTANDLFSFLREDWRIVFDQGKIQKTRLEDLGFSYSEVNWLLNSLEWKYCIEIEIENVGPSSTLEAFAQLIVRSSKPVISVTKKLVPHVFQ